MHRLEPAADGRTCGLFALMWQSPDGNMSAGCICIPVAQRPRGPETKRPRGPDVVQLTRRPEACSRGQLAAARSLGLAS